VKLYRYVDSSLVRDLSTPPHTLDYITGIDGRLSFRQSARAILGAIDYLATAGVEIPDVLITVQEEGYQAFAQVLKTHWGGTIQDIALAQHADDQVETVLLALSRGAGLPGLSAMPALAERGGLRIHRPWLDVPAQQLRDWLVQEGVTWVEDPTNQDERYTRNRIRHQLLPVLEEAFPSFRQTFGRSARHAAQAQTILDDMALLDLQLTGVPPELAALQQLSLARQANVLRAWLLQRHVACSTAQLDQLLHQIDACRTRGHQIDIKVGDGFVRRVGNHIDWYNF
jgi:tRNA(Ile)-lysidine synthase